MITCAMLFFLSITLRDGTPQGDIDPRSFAPDNVSEMIYPRYGDDVICNSLLDSFGDEFMVGMEDNIINAIGYQIHPAVAFDGTNYMVIWVDEREIWSRPMWSSNYVTSVVGARIRPDGVIIDTIGFQIYRDIINGPDNVAIAYGNGIYLVVWSEYGPEVKYDVWAARVNSQGQVLDPDGILICNASGFQDRPKVAFGDSLFLVTWADGRNDSAQIRATRVNAQGTVLDPDGFEVAPQAYCESPVCFDGTNWLVVWEDVRVGGAKSIFGARISQHGVVLDPAGINISNSNMTCRFPEISYDGTNYLAVWQDERTGGKDIWGTRVNTDGVPLDTAGIHISLGVDDEWRPDVDFDGANWYVTWHDLRNGDADLYGTRVTTSGTVLDPSGNAIFVASGYQGCPDICYGAGNYFIAWHEVNGWMVEVYGARMQPSGTVLDPQGIIVSKSSQHQAWSQAAFDGTNYLVVWMDYRGASTDYDICGTRVTPDGTILDPGGIVIASSSEGEYRPAIAFNGTNYLIVYERWINDWLDIYGTRVSPDGTVLDPGGVRISRQGMDEYSPAVASDGDGWFVLWEFYGTGSDPTLYGARVNASGVLIDTTNITVCNAPGWQWVPAVTFNGTNYFAAWSDNRNGIAEIYGGRISPGGTVLDPNGFLIAGGGTYKRYPSVAFDGVNHLVTWESQPMMGQSDIYASRIDTAGNVLDLIQLSFDGYDQFSPTVCYDGDDFIVAWHREYNYPYRVSSLIEGAHITSAGAILDTFMVSQIPGRVQILANLCSGPTDQILITYNGFCAEPYMAMRIVGRFLEPPVSVAEQNDISTISTNLIATPNPFIGYTKLSNHAQKLIDVYDIQGRLVVTEQGARIGEGLAAGVYFLKLREENSKPLQVIKLR